MLPPCAAAATAAHGGINYLDLVLRASLPVKLIVLLLLAGSLISWVIIFRKLRTFKAADQEADEFEGRFWSGAELGKLYAAATDRNRAVADQAAGRQERQRRVRRQESAGRVRSAGRAHPKGNGRSADACISCISCRAIQECKRRGFHRFAHLGCAGLGGCVDPTGCVG